MKKYVFISLTILLVGFSACHTVRPISGAHHDISVHMQYDSVCREHIRYMWLMGDTIRIVDSLFVYRDRIKHDSIYIRDTIPEPYPEIPKDYEFCKRSAIALYTAIAVMILGIILFVVGRCMRR